ncbi:MAG TPA: MFS transporter [Jatrophihabitans sp.]|nr:MFS transporter [Jatrophihabitans sp.]
MTSAEDPGAGSDPAADGFSSPSYHSLHPVEAPDPVDWAPTEALDRYPAPARTEPLPIAPPIAPPPAVEATDARPPRTAPTGTGELTVTRAVLARSRYFSKLVAHKVITASEADGAKESGLTALIWNQVMSYAADAMVTVALAGTVFFSAPSQAQRGNVLLYLLMTMAPFAVVAPVIGPALDRVQHGRRWVMAATAIGRAVLAVVMALNFTDLLLLFPAALGSLVLSKAYSVIRSSAAPRLVPANLTLVEANARLSLFGLAAAVLGGSFVGVAIKLTGSYPFGLWITAVAFAVTGFYSFRLPKIVDALPPAPGTTSARAERRARGTAGGTLLNRLAGWTKRGFAPPVIVALQGESALRWLAGFLTMFVAFYIEATSHGWQAVASLGAVGVATGLGNFGGTALGTRLKLTRPDLIILLCTSAAAAGCLLGALLFSLPVAIVAMLICMLCNALSKLSLDAIIQRDVAESLRSSAFGRSETFLQLAWVLGATIALLLPSKNGTLGFAVAAVVLVAVAVSMLVRERALRARRSRPAQA